MTILKRHCSSHSPALASFPSPHIPITAMPLTALLPRLLVVPALASILLLLPAQVAHAQEESRCQTKRIWFEVIELLILAVSVESLARLTGWGGSYRAMGGLLMLGSNPSVT